TNNNKNNNISSYNSSYQIYQDPSNGIRITYPSNWEKIEYPAGAMGYGVGHRIIASFLAPITNSSDQWRASISLQTSDQVGIKQILPQNRAIVNTNSSSSLGGHRALKIE